MNNIFSLECGGLITEDEYGNFGTIRAPGTERGGNYTDKTDCLWTLKAPEGRVIKITITKLDLQYDLECNYDVLIVSGGPTLHTVLHRFCNSESLEAFNLPERFKTFTTHDRFMTLSFHSDDKINGKGFELDWEFVVPNSNVCK